MKRRVLSVLIMLTVIFSGISVYSENVNYGEKVHLQGLETTSNDMWMLRHGTIAFEAEDIINLKNTTGSIQADPKASGGLAVSMPSFGWDLSETPTDNMYAKIILDEGEEEGNYKVWVRARSTTTETHCFWWDLNTGIWNAYYFDNTVDGEYYWICRSASINLYKDRENYIAIRRRGPCLVDKIVITNDTSYDPKEMNDMPVYMTPEEKEEYINSLYETPPITPIAGHPRLYIRPDMIPSFKSGILNNLDLSTKYDEIKGYANEEIDCHLRQDLEYNNNYQLLGRIISRAFVYMLGDADQDHARQTVTHMLDYLDTFRSRDDTSDITRVRGDIMVDASIVYDWCFDVLTESQKTQFKEHIIKLGGGKEVGWPPHGGRLPYNVASHSGEQEIFRDYLAAGVALYDEYPTIYNVAAGRMFQEMVPARQWLRSGGRIEQGHDYGECRHYSEMWADFTIQRMGYPSIYGDVGSEVAEELLRARLPHGDMMPHADMYTYLVTEDNDRYITQYYHILFGIAGNLYRNPQVKMEYERTMGIFGVNAHNVVFHMLFTDPTVVPATNDDLTLAKAYKYPVSGLLAKTSWQEGKNSDAAMAFVDMHEAYVGDHQHMSVGDFEIAYKGTLITDTGDYGGTMTHYNGYYKRTIAANVMLCKDPNETIYTYDKYYNAPNDGGQREPYIEMKHKYSIDDVMKVSEYELDENGIIQNKDLEICSDVKSYIGPDKDVPEFSYISGNLTNAYSDKVTDYHRSVVFMDLFGDDYPAAMVVFDKMDSADKTFKKTWLMHSAERPEVSKNTTTITRTQSGFDGKLVNTTLLPTRGNTDINVVGGPGNEMFFVDGSDVSPSSTEVKNGKYRIEISPKTEAKSDVFLNAMYVTSASANLPELPVYSETGNGYVGVTVKDRFVTFSKEAIVRDDTFDINVRNNGYDTVSCLLTDMKEGIWNVKGSGISINVKSYEGENTLYFKVAPGRYTVKKYSCDKPTLTEITYEKQAKREIGDFYVWNNFGTPDTRANGTFVYLEKPTENTMNNACVAVEVLKQFGASVSVSGDQATITCGTNTVTLTAGTRNYILNGEPRKFDFAPYSSNGTVYVRIKEFEDIIGYDVSWKPGANMLYVQARS